MHFIAHQVADRLNNGDLSDNLRQACKESLLETIDWDVAGDTPLPSYLTSPTDRHKVNGHCLPGHM